MEASTSASASSIRLASLGSLGALDRPRSAIVDLPRRAFPARRQCDERKDDASAPFAGIGQGIVREMAAAALPTGAQQLGDRRLDAFMGIGDYQLHTAQAPARQFAQEGSPEGFSFQGAAVHRDWKGPLRRASAPKGATSVEHPLAQRRGLPTTVKGLGGSAACSRLMGEAHNKSVAARPARRP